MIRLLRWFSSNPLVARQFRTSLSGAKLGNIFFLVTASLLLTDLILFIGLTESRAVGAKPVGSLVHFVHECVLYCWLAILLPLRVTGAIEGPRFSRTFDQVVVTGLSPWRLHAGNWLLALVYTLFLLLVSLPFECLASSFGGLSALDIARGYGVLFLHANLIIAVTIALSTLERDWLTMLFTQALFTFAAWISLIPEPNFGAFCPDLLDELAPLGWFLRDANPGAVVQSLLDLPPNLATARDTTWFFNVAVPIQVGHFIIWGSVLAVSLVYIAIGPEHRFQRGLDNFGTVVLPGDRKRRFTARFRFILTRRVEVAFLYQNCPGWLRRFDPLLRWVADVVLLLLFWGTLYGAAYQGSPAISGWGSIRVGYDELFLVLYWGSGLTFGFWMLLRVDPRQRLEWIHHLGPLRLPRIFVRWLGFAAIALVWISLILWHTGHITEQQRQILLSAPPQQTAMDASDGVETENGDLVGIVEGDRDDVAELPIYELEAPSNKRNALESVGRYWSDSVLMAIATVVFLQSVLLFSCLVGWWARSGLSARILTLGAFFGLVLASVIWRELVSEGIVPPWTRALAAFYPYSVVYEDSNPRTLRPGEAMPAFLLLHASFTALVLLGVFLQRRRARRRLVGTRKAAVGGATPAALALLFCSLLPPEISAQDAPTEAPSPTTGDGSSEVADDTERLPIEFVEVHRGFHGTKFHGAGDFFTIVVRNRSAETLEGSFWLRSLGSALPFTSPEIPFKLERETTRVFRWRRDIDEYDRFLHNAVGLVFESGGRQSAAHVDPPEIKASESSQMGWAWNTSAAQEELTRRDLLLVGETKRQLLPQAHTSEDGRRIETTHTSLLCLPESLNDWLGVEIALFWSVDFRQATESQVAALRDWVRLGGVALFGGTIEKGSLTALGDWSALFDEAPIDRQTVDGRQVVLRQLRGGTTLPLVLHKDGDAVPALRVVGQGAGLVGHFGVDLEKLPKAERQATRRTILASISSLPSGVFPLLPRVVNPRHQDRALRQTSSLFSILAYLGLYALLLWVLLVFFCRGKSRRLRAWVLTLSVVLAASIFLPIVSRILRSGSSHAVQREVVFHGAHEGPGLLFEHLRIVSAGRERHDVGGFSAGTAGDSMRAYRLPLPETYRYWGNWRDPTRFHDPLRQLVSESGKPTPCELGPWSSGSFLFVGEIPRPPTLDPPRATFDVSRSRLELEGHFEGGSRSSGLRVLACGLPFWPQRVRFAIAASKIGPGGALQRSWPEREFKSDDRRDAYFANQDMHWDGLWQSSTLVEVAELCDLGLSLDPSAGLRVFLIRDESTADVERQLTSEQLIFETPISARGVKALRDKWGDDSGGGSVLQRDGQSFRLRRHRVTVQECLLEIVE